jgi:hypothetical protein
MPRSSSSLFGWVPKLLQVRRCLASETDASCSWPSSRSQHTIGRGVCPILQGMQTKRGHRSIKLCEQHSRQSTLLAYAATHTHTHTQRMHPSMDRLQLERDRRDQKSRLLTAMQERLAMDGWMDENMCAYQSPVAYQSRAYVLTDSTTGFVTT